MKKTIRIIAIVLTIPCVLLAFLYIMLLMFSGFGTLPFEVDANVLFTDWFFLAIPILALLSSILLQVASLKKSSKSR
ncbi:MAG: hypothetical protein Q4A88_06765 [Clostridia bacterium]|nr:hypothetical protein [Clostridia bacterium]